MLKSVILRGLFACTLLHTCFAPVATAKGYCGNGLGEAAEQCDDGGICIGGSNAGTRCMSESECVGNGVCDSGVHAETACATDLDCPGGACIHCRTFGGDGCAANCTTEHDVRFDLVPGIDEGLTIRPGTSGGVINGDILTFAFAISGSVVLTIGNDRGDGLIPVVIRANAIQIPHSSFVMSPCTCLRGVADKTCGGVRFEADGLTPSPDCTHDESLCAGRMACASLHGESNAASGVIQCGQTSLGGVNLTVTQDAGGAGHRGTNIDYSKRYW